MTILDRMDQRILNELQSDGRLSNVELSNRIGLSESACLRRVKNLESIGIIDKYVALVEQEKVGLPNNVFVQVSLERQQEEQLKGFEKAVADVPEVMACYFMSGDFDFLMRVAVHDATDYERVHNLLTRLPGVARVHSSFALRTVFKRNALPLKTKR
jgi:Lrp/AsnC family transcriptional regulator, leucine-responsive regulatory protein